MKKHTIAMSIALAAVLAVSPAALAGCSGDNYSEINFSAQDTSYVVTSQGGSAVSYGNYVYFINGTRGYDDTNGTANVWDEVVKGALYRAEYNGQKNEDSPSGRKTFDRVLDENGLEFKYTESTDYFGAPLNVVNTTKIAPKTIGTSGYSNGGIFVYDKAVYFASPNNEKNSTGTVQSTHTDFFMMPLGGGEPTKIYTSEVDTTSSAYAFYKLKGAVYLVVNEGSSIVSVKINPDKEKADDPVKFNVGATSVCFPVRDTYYKGIANNTVEDYIYFVRNVKDGEAQRSGTVIEAMRPDGSENFVVSMTGETETIEGVRNGVFFYRTKNKEDETVIAYNSLHNARMEISSVYKREQEGYAARIAELESKLSQLSKEERKELSELYTLLNTQISGMFPKAVTSDITSTYAFRADESSNEVLFIGVTSSEVLLYSNNKSNPLVGTLCSTTGTPQFIRNNYLYLAGSTSNYYRVPLFEHMNGYGKAEEIATNTSAAGISCDYVDGYFTYFGEVDQWANGYTYFYKVDGAEGMERQFVGRRASSDIPSQQEIDDASGSSSSDD